MDLNFPEENFVPNFVDLLSKHKKDLPPKQQKIADFVLENPSFLNFATIQQVAQEAGVNVATVVRFCQSLGFSGYTHLRNAIRHYYIDRTTSWETLKEKGTSLGEEREVIKKSVEKDLENLNYFYSNISKQPLSEVIDKICQARRILCIGSGENSAAMVMSSLLRYIGTDSVSEVRGGIYLGQRLKDLTSKDLLIAFGYYRCDPIIIKTTEWANKENIPNLVVTDSLVAPLANVGETVLLVPTEGASFFQSSVAPLSLVNALISAVTERKKEKALEKLKKSRDIYSAIGLNFPRPGDQSSN